MLALEDGEYKAEIVLGEYAANNGAKKYVLDNGHLVNFTRPEMSPALALINDDKKRVLALTYLQEAAQLLWEIPREDQTNAAVARSSVDKHNAARLESTRSENAQVVKAVIQGSKYYQFK